MFCFEEYFAGRMFVLIGEYSYIYVGREREFLLRFL